MRIGFIGAGKVGCSLGGYLAQAAAVSGFYSRSLSSAQEAASFTGTACFSSLEAAVKASDTLLLTVPDGAIPAVWEQLRRLPLQNKKIGHCSGYLSSAVFTGIRSTGAFGCSVHPLYAVSSRRAVQELSNASFTLEGSFCCTQAFAALLQKLGNPVRVIEPADKPRYHAAASFASNLPIALWQAAVELLESCGFSEGEARAALAPMITGNAAAFCEKGAQAALTGPVERADAGTVAGHLAAIPPKDAALYRPLSQKLVEIARAKHPNRDFRAVERALQESGAFNS